MVHVQDVQRSADFYRLLGMEVRENLRDLFGMMQWIELVCERAQLMLTRASVPVVAGQQAVLFYLYSPDPPALREPLLAKRIERVIHHLPRVHGER